ncbi:MAG: FtsQ-type POTRA domain-containing protein [Verrucomicrobia bacterium]|nr:FtsQ-type POTRA domain-containing protein [Verrucomicrobiota bacterium]
MKRQTIKPCTGACHSVLHARVWSARLFCVGFLKCLFRFAKIACVLAVAGGIVWGLKWIIRSAFYDNPEFRLQTVDLNPNQAIDEIDLVRVTGLNLRANLFEIDRAAIAKCLAGLPEIADASVGRRLPGTLVVRVTARTPRAWLACPDAGLPAARKVGALLVDGTNFAYPCSARQFEAAALLPIIVLPARDKEPIATGETILQPELQRCLRLLTTAGGGTPAALDWIDSIQQTNAWSLALTTRGGTVATLGLGDHARQVANLRAALNHAANQGYTIATINLIPKENVPITVNDELIPPRAIPVADLVPQEIRPTRRTRNLKTLLNRE